MTDRRREIFGDDDSGKEQPHKKGYQKGFTLECLDCGNKLGQNKGGFELKISSPVKLSVENKQLKFQVPQFNLKLFADNIDWEKGVKCLNCGSTNVKVNKFEKEL